MGAATAFEIRKGLANLWIARIGIVPKEGRRGHDPAIEAIAALRNVFLNKSRLNRVWIFFRSQPGQGCYLAPFGLRDRCDAGAGSLTVDMDGARSALSQAASKMRVGIFEIVAQRVEQRHLGIDIDLLLLPINIQGNPGHNTSLGRLSAAPLP